jgi:beta-mannanase
LIRLPRSTNRLLLTTETAAALVRPASSEIIQMNTKRVATMLSAAMLAAAMALPVLAQNNPSSTGSAHNADAAGSTNTSGGTLAAATHPTHQHAAHAKKKKKKQSFSKRMHDKAEKILSAIKQ